METEETAKPSKWFLIGLTAVMLLVVGGVAASLAVPLQPSLTGPGGPIPSGTVIMPKGVGMNLKLDFEPAVIVVIIGQNNTVTFTNQDSVTHTVTATDGSFNSGNIMPGKSWVNTFDTPGNYSFHCIYHTWMKGMIIVEAAPS